MGRTVTDEATVSLEGLEYKVAVLGKLRTISIPFLLFPPRSNQIQSSPSGLPLT